MCALADADWLEAVATSRHPSPNHDLCCRLLAHIPLLAAYTGWPREYHLHVNSQAGTQLFQTANNNGGSDITNPGNADVAETCSDCEDQLMKWRLSEEEKNYVEQTVRSLVDREDLCRLLMVAMAIELERPTGLHAEHEDQSSWTGDESLRHAVQCSAGSSPGDHDAGDTTHDVHANKPEQSNRL